MKRAGWLIGIVATFVLGFGAAWLLFARRAPPVPAPLVMPRFTPPPQPAPPPSTQPSTQPSLPAERPEPEPPPRRAEAPAFQPGQVWRGEYVCAQGATNLELTIDDVSFNAVRAVFSFRHAPTGIAGDYHVSGEYDPRSHRIVLEPGAWIHAPPNYFPVGMDGRISADGRSFSGRILHPSCTSFLVHLR